jgi:hypothetical protein
MSSGAWNTVRERKKFADLVNLCKFVMDADPTDDPDYEDEDNIDDLLELTYAYGISIGRTLGSTIDFTVGPLRVAQLDEVKAINDFRKFFVERLVRSSHPRLDLFFASQVFVRPTCSC